MPQKKQKQIKLFPKERCQDEGKKTVHRSDSRPQKGVQNTKTRKFESLLELGRLIGLDLQIDEMILQISQKACEVMEADRCSIFLFDPNTDELWSTVALGMAGGGVRNPTRTRLARRCVHTR